VLAHKTSKSAGRVTRGLKFRAPYRYTASARCEQDTRVVRIPRDAFTELFQRDARCGVVLLHRVASTMAARVEQTRDRLVEVHLGETEDARGTPPAATVTTTAGPRWELDRTIQFFHHSPFFEEIAPRHLGHLARVARAESFEKGQVLFTQNQPAFALFLLQEGKVGLYYGGQDAGERVFMRSIAGTGEPLGWSALVEPRHYRVTGVALEATRALAIPSDELEAYGEAEPAFGLALMHKVLWVIGNRLRSTRIRLVAKRYDKEALAVRALLDQSAESLHVTSPLHKIPYLLDNRLTLADAFHTLGLVQAHGDSACF